ncbi:MAG TPA: DEAD/DEAH box helicase [Thermoanaerobaculia bacterium]|nr:DEAD/DEAH box helicase [Thermoanaerobaculia bacterium]
MSRSGGGTGSPLAPFHPIVRDWFIRSFERPTGAQVAGWRAIAAGESTLVSAPTGSGKTLAAFLWAIDRLMFAAVPPRERRCRVLYVSPLKALAVDVERNLRSPLIGISRAAGEAALPFHVPTIAIRTGDTPSADRERFRRDPADILITTPESLYLMLTSRVREVLRGIDTVIIDEIHALVPGKRGAHLAISLERLERSCDRPPQRIGLSATQRPLDEVARFLGGVAAIHPPPQIDFPPGDEPGDVLPRADSAMRIDYRPVTIVDTGERKRLELRVEVPVEEMAKLNEPVEIVSGPAARGPSRPSIWPAIHPKLLEMIRAHRSTLIFVNSRRLAERLAAALNELAGETVVHAHHGSLARPQRVEIEDKLKSGKLPGLVATSSLELGIDMGAIDLVVQIESPPSVSSGLQRIGRASHHVGEASEGVIVPKFRGDLLACASLVRSMLAGEIEPIAYPRNPLDVLAQQIVAMVSMDPWDAGEMFDLVRSAAPWASLSRTIFDGVLDMLSGRYPSDEFAELRPRITWDRIENRLTGRPGAQKIAIANGGTIPDRGLYGVFLAGADKGAARVGELDEEMVFESSPGEVFVLGASSWRIEEITHDRVIVVPAPGEPGKMPFWHGDSAGRTVDFGRRIGELTREVREAPRAEALERLIRESKLDRSAAKNLVGYVDDQVAATEAVPDDLTILIERVRDELGDWRLCVLSPLGGRILAPWAMAVLAKVRDEKGIDLESMWSDDGFVIRFPDTPEPPETDLLLPSSREVEQLVVRQLASSALFAARFREAAARALLLPRRRPGQRAPLWQQRKRSSDLLKVASRFGSFPILLETYRECLRDVFDLPALIALLEAIERRSMRVVTVETEIPSPFAATVLFRYVANYLYDGDAPMAERRAQALTIDRDQLRELLGETDLRQLLDAGAIEETEQQLQHLAPRFQARTMDGIHDLLLRLGDLTREEIARRSASPEIAESVDTLSRARRIIEVAVGGERRFIASEDASRYRDALGTPLPPGLPEAFLEPGNDPVGILISRYARTHGPFTVANLAGRLGMGPALARSELERLSREGRVLQGEFRPGGSQREWCHPEVLDSIRRKSLAKLRKEIEPLERATLGRLLTAWQGVGKKRQGLNAILDAIETLQGFPIPASILETEVLPARIDDFRSSDLDTLFAAGEAVWIGIEGVGDRDGRIALYLTDRLPLLHVPAAASELDEMERAIVNLLKERGASFFAPIHEAAGAGFPGETIDALWRLVWKGVVTNDSLHALRGFTRRGSKRKGTRGAGFRSRRSTPAAGEGRWSLVEDLAAGGGNSTERAHALAQQLLNRYGIVSRDMVSAEVLPGGFSSVYEVFKRLEESGRVRRGYFVAGMTATQFAVPAAVDLLRSFREGDDTRETHLIASADPANPWGSVFRWPESAEGGGATRSAGTKVILVNGGLAAHLSRGDRNVKMFLPADEPDRSAFAREVARALASLVLARGSRQAMLIEQIDGLPAIEHPLAPYFTEAGFHVTALGLQLRSVHSGFRFRESAAEVVEDDLEDPADASEA